MLAAILSGNTVVNVVVVDSLEQMPGAIDGAGAGIGDTWNGSEFVKPPPSPPPAPFEVTMRQARRALHAAGLYTSVDAAIAALPEPQRTAAAIDWEFSNTVQRSNPTFSSLATALGLSSAQLDALFVAADGY